jgi:uncharacterized protein YhaN
MRFRRLGFDAYGPFTGMTLDLTRVRGNGLHLIYGPNEAGKSSALRALRDLLFGIPQNTPDAHMHVAQALRLSALIERDGDELAFVRRKKRKDSLFALDDKLIEEARLSRFLNGIDAASFDRLFGLDHERLQRGGDEMLSGQGDVGEALFDAGASGRSVHRVKLALVEEAEALFKDRAQKPELNRLLSAYAEQKRRAKDAVHSPEKYEEQQEQVRETRREAEARRQELARLRSEKEHLGRLRNVLSSVLERDRKSLERAALGPVPALAQDVTERRERIQAGLAETERDCQRLTRQLAELEAKLARLPAPAALLAIAPEAIGAIYQRIGRAEKDLADLPGLEAKAAALREVTQAQLVRLDLGADLEGALGRNLPVAEQARLEALGREFQGLSLKLEAAERDLPEAQAEVEQLRSVLEQAKATRRLAPQDLVPNALLERFDGELAQAEEGVESCEERLRDAERERAGLLQKLLLLKGHEGVPSEALLVQARAERDARLREAQELAADPKRKALELCLPLAVLAQAGVKADHLVDRLRKEAERVAGAEALEQQLAERQRELLVLGEARDTARSKLAEVAARWDATRSLLSRAELLPREALRLVEEEREAWREIERKQQEHAKARAAASTAEARAQAARRALDEWRSEWQTAAAPLGLGPDARPEQALALLGALGALSTQREKLAELERRVKGLRRDIAQFAALVGEQTEAFAPELSALAPPLAAARLVEQHGKASAVALERSAIEHDLGRVKAELAEAEAQRTAEARALAELCRECGVDDAALLLELERKVERARALDADLVALDARLAEVGGDEQVSGLVEEARRSDRGAVSTRLDELDELIAVREEDWRECERRLTGFELGAATYAGLEGAQAAQELSATVARLAQLSSSWVRRRLAAVVLERVVDGYRERHQGPVLTRASELFQRLTLGRFAKLQVGLEETRLECVEADGGRGLELEELSRGTRFQLYMALKLASLEQYLKTAPPLPLVLDDVLVEWDNERAKVALSVLAEFSERVQILLFTHLVRDVDAASELADGRILTHHLVPRGVRGNADEGALVSSEGLR